MIWFIDIDGCLSDNHEDYLARCSKWLDNNMITHTEARRDCYDFGKAFGVDPKLAEVCYESEEFADYYIVEPAAGAVEFLQELHKDKDATIVILTAREPDSRIPITERIHEFLGPEFDSRNTIAVKVITKLWLEKHDIPFDNIIHRKDKVAIVSDCQNAVAIEDSPKTLEEYKEAGCKCIAIRADYNDGLDVLYADTWFDIDKMHRVNVI